MFHHVGVQTDRPIISARKHRFPCCVSEQAALDMIRMPQEAPNERLRCTSIPDLFVIDPWFMGCERGRELYGTIYYYRVNVLHRSMENTILASFPNTQKKWRPSGDERLTFRCG